MTATIKTMLLWTRKGCRKPKMQGTATAVCSAATIEQFRKMARAGEGRFWLVDARTAEEARRIIAAHVRGSLRVKEGRNSAAFIAVTDEGRTVALGRLAVAALGGAREACEKWDERIRRQGKVTERQSKALTGDEDLDMRRAFGRGPGGVL